MCTSPPTVGCALSGFWARSLTFAAREHAGQGRGHMAHDACGLGVDTRYGICADTGRTDIYREVVLGIYRVCGMLPRGSAIWGVN